MDPVTFELPGDVVVVTCDHKWKYVDFHGQEFFYCLNCKRREDPDTGEVLP